MATNLNDCQMHGYLELKLHRGWKQPKPTL
jgi:hypothetical protein